MASGEMQSTMAQLPLTYGCTAVFEAIDQATGLPVAGVKITDPVVYGYNLTTDEPEEPTIVDVGPAFLPLPVTPPAADGSATTDGSETEGA